MNKDIAKGNYKERIYNIKKFLTENEFNILMIIISSILILGNYKQGNLQKNTLKEIADLLQIDNKIFVKYFIDVKNQWEKIKLLMFISY